MAYKEGSALSDIRVLDLGCVLSAPLGASLLADMGADVIKIERPQTGDSARFNNPIIDGVSTYYINFNRSKRGITLNMKSEKGKEVLRRLIETADVLIENFRPGVMDKLGFSYEDVSRINPQIIYASISGFGQDGPYAHRAGYESCGSGHERIDERYWRSGRKAIPLRSVYCRRHGRQNMVLAILAALHYRERTGRGQRIDVALTDVCIIGMSSVNLTYLTKGEVPQPQGNGYTASAPGDSYKTKDGSVVLLAGTQAQWVKLCEVLGHPEWTERMEFRTNVERVQNKTILNELIDGVIINYTTDEIVKLLLDAGLPAGPIMNVEQVVSDQHFAGTRKMFTTVNDPKLGEIKIMNQSFKMSETTPYVRGSAPMLGQDNEEVLRSLGYSTEEIKCMKEEHVI